MQKNAFSKILVGDRCASHSFAISYWEPLALAEFGKDRPVDISNVGERGYDGTLFYCLRRVTIPDFSKRLADMLGNSIQDRRPIQGSGPVLATDE